MKKKKQKKKKDESMFWLFGILQAITMFLIVFFILRETGIGLSSQITLGVALAVFTLIVEYIIYEK